MTTKEKLYHAGIERAQEFCAVNKLTMPGVKRLINGVDRLYHLATCAFYRPTLITIMVEKCAAPGTGGRCWSWPGYAIDRTPYGVIQHELGHHVDGLLFGGAGKVFSQRIYEESKEKPLTGYLGTDDKKLTFFMEWFAENFRLFVTNPDLSYYLRPRFFRALMKAGLTPINRRAWHAVLKDHGANERILTQAKKKIDEVSPWNFTL